MKLPESWKTFFINGEQNSFVRSLSILDKFTGCLDKAKVISWVSLKGAIDTLYG